MNISQETAGLLPGTGMSQVGGAQESVSFANFLTQRQAVAEQHLNNLVGVAADSAAGVADLPLDQSINLEAIDTVAGLLRQMMALLQQQANPVQTMTGPGEWLVSVPDTGLLEQLGQAAGMTSEQLGKFVQPFSNNKEKVNLEQLLNDLTRHFVSLAKEQAITVPDTDLPLFQFMLSKMGVEVNSLDAMASKVITKDDKLDLVALLAALKDLPAAEEVLAVPLSPQDLEQLQDVLLRAGVPAEKLPALLTMATAQSIQSAPSIQSALSTPSTQPTTVEVGASLTVQGLKDLLAQAVQDIQAARPQTDPALFLKHLEEVFAQANFQEQGVGWSPVVRNAIENVYQELLAIVDPATVQVSAGKADSASAFQESGKGGSPETGQGGDRLEQFDPTTTTETEADGSPVGNSSTQSGLEEAPEKPLAMPGHETQPATMAASHVKETVVVPQEIQTPAALPRTAPVLVQQTMEQLSQGVLHGARNNEHHLVLKLFPEDLGEVKVVLHVRNEQVSVSFTMPNTQVKEILEQNMQQFRDNLQKHGFILEQCSASLDYHDKGNSGQSGFDLALRSPWEGGRGSVAELPEDVFYRQASAPARAGGIDLFL